MLFTKLLSCFFSKIHSSLLQFYLFNSPISHLLSTQNTWRMTYIVYVSTTGCLKKAMFQKVNGLFFGTGKKFFVIIAQFSNSNVVTTP